VAAVGNYCVVLFTGSECKEHPGRRCVMDVQGPYPTRQEAADRAVEWPDWTTPHIMLMHLDGPLEQAADPAGARRLAAMEAADPEHAWWPLRGPLPPTDKAARFDVAKHGGQVVLASMATVERVNEVVLLNPYGLVYRSAVRPEAPGD
jgi:hypothetical protein